jgi:adenylate kinase
MNKLILIGPQGSGKGTQADLLAKGYNFVHISIGDIFRWNMANHTKLAARVTRIMNEGRLVPDEIVEEVVRGRLEQHDWNYGFILDGFPRTRPQAEFLFESWNMDHAIYLDVPEDIVFDRVLKRAQAGQGGGFTKRADDNIPALRVRLKEFREKTTPLLSLFEEKDMLITVDGNRPVEEVFQTVRESLSLPAPAAK